MTKIRLRPIIWLLAISLMLAPAALAAAGAGLTVTRAQHGQEIGVKVGEVIQVELPGNAGTGYSWFVEAPAVGLKLISQSTRTASEPRPGSPVMQVWRFRAEKPGTAELRLAYYRPWEGVGQAADHFTLIIRVR